MDNFYTPDEHLICIGQPNDEEMRQILSQYEPALWINLRPESESGQIDNWVDLVEQRGGRAIRLPTSSATDISFEHATKLKVLLDSCDSEKSVVIQCGSSNRVGALMALIAYKYNDQDIDTALKYGRAAGLTKDGLIQKVQAAI